jgi:hypothetical protein
MKKSKVTKSQIIKQGKSVFGNMDKFNLWLNTECQYLGCKPITIYESGKLDILMNELVRIDQGILC